MFELRRTSNPTYLERAASIRLSLAAVCLTTI
jgi:hypothetical protein